MRFRLPAFLAVVAVLISCGGSPVGDQLVDPDGVARVELQPESVSIPAGATVQLNAVAIGRTGATLPGQHVSFSSSSASIATVSSSGLVTGVAVGNATVSASSQGKSATTSVQVTAAGGAVARVEVVPATANLPVGASVRLTATAYDAAGRVTGGGAPVWSSSDAAVATVTQTGLVTAVRAGSASVTASISGQTRAAPITVLAAAANAVDVNPSETHQTITGWEAEGQNGWLDCQPIFGRYKNELYDRVVNELGINRMLTTLRSGEENTVDYLPAYIAGTLSASAYAQTWYLPVNDNADPFVTDASRFQWRYLDGQVDSALVPVRQRLMARGERLYWVLQYIDFLRGATTKFYQMRAPDEYAEFVLAAFQHLKQKYGFTPDALELVLEPEHTNYTPAEIGRAMVAAVARLKAAGFTPAIIGPSTTSMTNASIFYDQMMEVPGAKGLLTELSYHRYVGVNAAALQAIGQRVLRDNVKASMLEHIGSGFDDLYQDLTVANASAWMQYATAYCGAGDDAGSGGVYYHVNRDNGRLTITNHSKLLRQVFAYVRFGAVRIGATTGGSTLQPLAFRNTSGKVVAVVRTRQATSIAVRGLPAGTYGINYSTPGDQWNVNLPDQTISAGESVQVNMPAEGVLTVYGK